LAHQHPALESQDLGQVLPLLPPWAFDLLQTLTNQLEGSVQVALER
jgi:hypothetical protein